MRFPLPPSVAGSSHPSQGTGSARSLSLPAASSQELAAPCLSLRQKQTAPAPGSVRGPFLSVLEFRRPQGSLSLRTVTRPPKSPHTTRPSQPAFSVSKRGSRRATWLGARRERPLSRPRRARAEARDGGCRSPKRPFRGRREAVASTFSRPRAESADLARVLIPGAHGL